jgi:lysyl-tRNA synthetase class 2
LSQFESEFERNLYAQRQEKLREISAIGQRLGLSPAESIYPNRFPAADEQVTFAHIPDLLERYNTESAPISGETLEAEHPEFAVAGRIMSIRLQGKAGFAHLQQGGKRLQIYVRKDDVGEDIFALYKLLDLGDHIGVRGHLMRTRTGELTLKALPVGGKPAISFLSKGMLALPDKYHGLEDVELRYRQRYVDLIMNSGTLAKAETEPESSPETSSEPTEHRNVRDVFVKRAAILRAIRRFFDDRGYL